MLKLLIADDHSLFRRGLARLLSEPGDFVVVGEAESGPQAVQLARELRPDLALMDMQMPGGGGVEAVRQLAKHCPGLPVVMLTVSASDADLLAAVRAGARGYLLKTIEADALFASLRRVAAGQAVVDPNLTARLFEFAAHSAPESVTPLSGRETEILRLVASGCTNREIAARLNVSDNTVKTHIANILEKLGAPGRAEAADLARQRGWLTG